MWKRVTSLHWRTLLRQAISYLLLYLQLPVLAILLVGMLECLSRTSFRDTYDWILEYPRAWWFNCWIGAMLLLLFQSLVGRSRVAYILIFTCFGVIGFYSGWKTNHTGSPLYIWDIVLPQDGQDSVWGLNPGITAGLLYTLAAAVILFLVSICLKEVRWNWKFRVVIGVLTLYLLNSFWHDLKNDELGIMTIHYEPVLNVQRNGFLFAGLDGLQMVQIHKPAHNSPSAIQGILNRQAGGGELGRAAISPALTTKATKENPNVVVILSESFWDPTLLPHLTFSEDPIPHFHQLMKETSSGWMLSPQYGGTTANVEFEVLTGLSVRFLPRGSIGYINEANREIDSLAGIFTRQGYQATAINPYYNWFFNSRNAYRNMGFSRFISSEFFEPRYHGPNLEDSQVMEKIIETMDHTSGPDFVFANTMENHASYEDKFTFNPIKVEGEVSSQTKNILENYATGEQAFDKALYSLVQHYKESGEPTVILCFGDHQAALGGGYYAYKQTGYISGSDDPSFMDKMHNTPFVLWSNIGNEPKQNLHMSANFLGTYMLHVLNKPGTYLTDYLYGLSQELPLLPPLPFIKDHPVDESLLADYKSMEYDILFGRQEGYRLSGIHGHVRTPSFTLGYGNPVVEKAVESNTGKLEVTGELFNSQSSVWLNGKRMDTVTWEPHRLIANLPDTDRLPGLPWSVQVKVVDSKGAVLVESNKQEVVTISSGKP